MRIFFLPVDERLKRYIHSFWYFDSPAGLPTQDQRIIAPNGCSKIILTLQGTLITTDGEITNSYAEGRAWLIGPWDRPIVLSSPPGATRTVGLELLPTGVHHIFRYPFRDLRNCIVDLSDFEPLLGPETIETWNCRPSCWVAARALESLLLKIMANNGKTHWIVDCVSEELEKSRGLVSIRDLELKTGYSRRLINMVFGERVGLPPKTLATILRFQTVYQAWARLAQRDFYKEPSFDLYADQSHMIREFRRFTGHAPAQYGKLSNEFGRIFYSNNSR